MRRRSIIWITILSIICTLLIWHTTYWYSTGMHDKFIELLGEDKAYLSVIYNIGLIAFLAVILGLLLGKISELMSHWRHADNNPENPNKADVK